MGHYTHKITRARACPRTGGPCLPGHAMMARLNATIEGLGSAVSDAFEMSGTATLACGAGPCHAVWHATCGATQIYTDTSPSAEIDTLVPRAHRGGVVVAERSMEPVQ